MENWKQNPRVFWTLGLPPSLWLLAFFIIPLGFLFIMSFSDKAMVDGEVSITGYDYLTGITNYIRAFDPLYLGIMWKSVWISALATALCLLFAYPIAFGICFAKDKWKPLLLLLVVVGASFFWLDTRARAGRAAARRGGRTRSAAPSRGSRRAPARVAWVRSFRRWSTGRSCCTHSATSARTRWCSAPRPSSTGRARWRQPRRRSGRRRP